MKELLKYTAQTHKDYFFLSMAYQEFQKLGQEANERKRSLEYLFSRYVVCLLSFMYRNAARVTQIQRKMVWSGQKLTLLVQNRELVHEGVFSATVTKQVLGIPYPSYSSLSLI